MLCCVIFSFSHFNVSAITFACSLFIVPDFFHPQSLQVAVIFIDAISITSPNIYRLTE